MAENPITSESLTIDYRKLLKIPIGQRIDAFSSNPNLLEALTPIQIAKAFPGYYKQQLPDVSSFITSNIEKKNLGRYDQTGGGKQGRGYAGYTGEAKLDKSVPAGRAKPRPTINDMKKSLLKKGIDVDGIYGVVGDGGIPADDERVKLFKGMSDENLTAAGFQRTKTEDGKTIIKRLPSQYATMSDEQLRAEAKKTRIGDPSAVPLGQLTYDNKGYVDQDQLYGVLVQRFKNSSLNGFVPDDGEKFGVKNGTPEEWARLAVALGKQESSLHHYPGNGYRGGMYQFRNEDLARYGVQGDPADPNTQIEAMARQWEKYIPQSGGIAGQGSGPGTYGGYRGGAAYFEPLRYPDQLAKHWDSANNSYEKYIQSQQAIAETASPEEIRKALQQRESQQYSASLAKQIFEQQVAQYAIDNNISPERTKEYLSEVAKSVTSLTEEQKANRPSHLEGFVEFQGLDKKFKAGSGGRTADNPSTPYDVYKLPEMSAPGPKLAGKFAAMRGEGNTEIINIPNTYDPTLGRTRTEMQFHPAIAPRDVNGDDVADLISSGCIAVDPSQYDDFMATYKQYYKDNNGNVWLSVLPGPPGQPAKFSITNKKPEASDILPPNEAQANFQNTGVVSPETYSQSVDSMSTTEKTTAFGSNSNAEQAVQQITGPASLDQSIVIPNQINPNLPGGDTAMAEKKDLQGIIFHKTPLTLEQLQSGDDPRAPTFGYNTAILSSYVDANGNKISEAEWKKLSSSEQALYTETAEVHQIRSEDIRPNQMKPSDNAARTDIGRDLNNTNALGIVTIGSDSPAKQEAAQNYLAELIAKNKLSESALTNTYGHGEVQADEGRPEMDPGRTPEGSVMADAIRNNVDLIKKKADELKQENQQQAVPEPIREEAVDQIKGPAATDQQSQETTNLQSGGVATKQETAQLDKMFENGATPEVSQYRTGGSPYTQDDEDLNVVDKEGNLRWQMNSGEGVYVKPEAEQYADEKMQELSDRIDQMSQQPQQQQTNQTVNIRQSPVQSMPEPDTKWRNAIAQAQRSPGTQQRAFNIAQFRPVPSRRLGERGSPNMA